MFLSKIIVFLVVKDRNMPQLDFVTAFSQVFWLLVLYFLVFFIVLRYYLPKFSKLFKLRLVFVEQDVCSNLNKGSSSIQLLNTVLASFKNNLDSSVASNLVFYSNSVKDLNQTVLLSANAAYISLYNFNMLKYNVYKKLYL